MRGETFLGAALALLVPLGAGGGEVTVRSLPVGHRGLMRDAPENTLAGFSACIATRIGFELDIRRTRDGHLVVMHDDDVRRTTDGQGKVADLTLADLRKLDAGRWFDPAFTGERVPTLEEVFILLARAGHPVLAALDIKVDDPTIEADIVRLAQKHGVLKYVVCIGRAIDNPGVRRRLRAADMETPVAVLATGPEGLAAALGERDADWIYVRFVPSAAQVTQIHQRGKRIFMSGPLVAGEEPKNWLRAQAAGVLVVLTDYPLQCRQTWRMLPSLDHEKFMRLAIEQAKKMPKFPFGAVIVDSRTGEVLAEGHNRSTLDPTFHGEMDVIHRLAASPKRPANWAPLVLYTTAEPCSMCQSGIEWAGIGAIVYGSSIPLLQRLGWWQIDVRAEEIIRRTPFRRTALLGGVLEQECDALFTALRPPGTSR